MLDLKNKDHIDLICQMLKTVDVVIDPFRPGVLEKVGLGPTEAWKINRRIIFLRISGYGQNGDLALDAGHDLNYISYSGRNTQF